MVEIGNHEIPMASFHSQSSAANTSRRRLNTTRKSSVRRNDWLGPDGSLYDRAEQQQQLRDAYYRSKQQAEIAIITGASGTGKTVLANTLVPLIEADGGLYLKGKFDLHQSMEVMSPCFRMFQFYAKRVIARGKEEAERVRKAIEKEMGSEINILLEIIPELGELLTPEEWLREQERAASSSGMDSSQSSALNGEITESQARVVSVFRRFLRACCSRERPIVLFLDDLQWADSVALDIMAGRMNETTEESRNPGLLFLASCRGNEVSVDDRLSVVLRGLEEKGTPITDIRVGNLSFDAQADMISNFLHLPRAEVLPLVEVVNNQTQGNAFFAIQFLKSLEEEGVLYKDKNKGGKWAFKAEELMVSLEGTGNDDLIIQLLANKIKEMPTDALEVVKAASCLGNEFTEEILCHSGAAAPDLVLDALDIAEEEGVIAYDFDTGIGYFVHDKFKEAAYSLIPLEQRQGFHLRIARALRQQLPNSTSKSVVSIILSQIAAGLDELTDPEEREECAVICLKAARKAGKASSYVAASEYAELGIRLLEPRTRWRDQYDLSLSLYNTAAELGCCSGNHERVQELVKEVVEHGRNFNDKLQVHIAKILTLQAEAKTKAAITYCIEILRRLGEPFPKKPNLPKIIIQFVKIKRKLAKISDDDIMKLPPLTDPKVTTAMVFIHQLFPLVQQERFEYSPLIAFRLVSLTLKYGLSSISSCAFNLLGAVLARKGDLDEAYRYIQLSFRILDRYPSDNWRARCMLVSCGTVLSTTEPLRDLIDLSMEGHRLGLKAGELECGLILGVFNCLIRMMAGDHLPTIAKGNKQLAELSHDYRQEHTTKMAFFVYQLNLLLQGDTPDSDQVKLIQEMLLEAKQENRTMLLLADMYIKYVYLFYAEQYELAATLSRENRRVFQSAACPLPMFKPLQTCFEGLVFVSLARDKKGTISVARKNLARLESMVLVCPENVVHKAQLLRAEILAFDGKYDEAMHKYLSSIKYAEKAGYVQEQALANEKTGCMLLRRGLSSQALPFIKEAKQGYSQWGSQMKVDKMDEIIGRLHVNGHGEK